jgi:poly(hydroxyalkanoate) granule-associated protein
MAKKMQEPAHKAAKAEGQFAQSVRDSALQIWLAGLGAFSKTQAEGGKVFESLVKEGESLHRKTRGIAQAKVAEVSDNVSRVANQISSRAQSAASQTWGKLEEVFEERVVRSLKRMGVPTASELAALAKRIDALAAAKAAPRKPSPAKKAAGKKAANKKAATAKGVGKKAVAKKATARKVAPKDGK